MSINDFAGHRDVGRAASGSSGDEYPADFPHVGDVLRNRYVVVSLREGGFGVVFVVTDRELGTEYAVKTLKPKYSNRPHNVELFRREMDFWLHLGSLQHIVQAHFIEVIDNRPFLFMEYVDGGRKTSIRDWMATTEPIGSDRALDWAGQFCVAMEEANGQGEIAHCDLKPENILVSRDNIVKVTDFGGARRIRVKGGVYPKAELFTPLYASPEALDRRAVSSRSDIYSFGVILYEMLTGALPYPFIFGNQPVIQREQLVEFHSRRGMENISRALYLGQVQIAGVKGPVHAPLCEVMAGCVAHESADRHRDFRTLRRALNRIRKLPSVTSSPAAESTANLHKRAVSLHRIGRFSAALSIFNRLLQLEPNNGQLWLDAAATLRAAGLDDEANRFVRSAAARGVVAKTQDSSTNVGGSGQG